jgi:hypothetical protein
MQRAVIIGVGANRRLGAQICKRFAMVMERPLMARSGHSQDIVVGTC